MMRVSLRLPAPGYPLARGIAAWYCGKARAESNATPEVELEPCAARLGRYIQQ